MSKYFNNALIGNSNILGCLTDKGELIRLYYPNIDYFQNIDSYKFGILDNNVKWFENANAKKQYYEGNILYTELEMDGVEILQRDYVQLYPREWEDRKTVTLEKVSEEIDKFWNLLDDNEK